MRSRFWLLVATGLWLVSGSAAVSAADTGSGTLTGNELIFKSSELRKLNVYNRADSDAKLGRLSDLIIGAHMGNVLYGCLSPGIMSNNVIVPWNAFLLEGDPNSRKFSLTLNKSSDDLKNAPIFDTRNPPDFSNSQWRGQVNDFYGVRTVARPTGSGELSTNQLTFRASALEGLNVISQTESDKKLGHLSDLIINAHTGQVMYGILNTGLMGKYIPVPWSVLQVRENNKKAELVLNKTTDELKNAPSFDMKSMPDFTSAEWQGSVDRFFGLHRVARPAE
jgi:sporulation protein YlmC with PRC-barrel domain